MSRVRDERVRRGISVSVGDVVSVVVRDRPAQDDSGTQTSRDFRPSPLSRGVSREVKDGPFPGSGPDVTGRRGTSVYNSGR